jgi:hypothetical protein
VAFAALLTASACGASGGSDAAGHRAADGRTTLEPPPPISNSAHRGGRDDGMVDPQRGRALITIQDFGYSGDLTVEPGADVTVVNKDAQSHTLTDKRTHLFDTGVIAGGGTGSFVAPTKAGKYPFGCTLHPEMSGVLTVTGG